MPGCGTCFWDAGCRCDADATRAAHAAARRALTEQIDARRDRLAAADFVLKRDIFEIVEVYLTLGHRDGQKTLTIASLIAPPETIDIPRSWRRKKRKAS